MGTRKTSKKAEVHHCVACEAACCRYTAIEIDKPTCKSDYDNIRWYLMHKNVFVFVSHDGDWFVEFESPCTNLGPNHLCQRYEERPRICREHGDEGEECVFFTHSEPHVYRFENAYQYESYLEEQGKEWRFKEMKTKKSKAKRTKKAK